MKKLFALLLAMVMVFSLAATAFAEDDVPETTEDNRVDATGMTGSITINGATEAPTYSIYRLLDLESYDPVKGAYSYKVNSAWANFFKTEVALNHVHIDAAGYVTWTAGEDDATIAAFAKEALKYAQATATKIEPVMISKDNEDFSLNAGAGTFSDLSLGWYLVDTTVGALCGLTTTNPDASINAKNRIPEIVKEVKEDSTGQWLDKNSADIGQLVEFRTTISVHPGAQKYVLHDILPVGMTLEPDSSVALNGTGITGIYHIVPGVTTADGIKVSEDDYEIVKNDVCKAGCTFEIHFDPVFCESLKPNDKIMVYYGAMLNRDAVVAGAGNVNTTWLAFGDGHETTKVTTTTYTYGFDVIKTDSQNTLIDGAQFRIYDAKEGGHEIGVVAMEGELDTTLDEKYHLKNTNGDKIMLDVDGDGKPDPVTKVTVYRRARADEQKEGLHAATVVVGGQTRVIGFDNGTYYMEETVNPDGYNKLTERQEFIISDGNLDAIFNGQIFSKGSGVHIVNKTGSMLPETGAMGTTMFIVFGMFVMLGTGVLLVTKKRMSMIED